MRSVAITAAFILAACTSPTAGPTSASPSIDWDAALQEIVDSQPHITRATTTTGGALLIDVTPDTSEAGGVLVRQSVKPILARYGLQNQSFSIHLPDGSVVATSGDC